MLSIFNMQRGTPAGEAVDVHNNQPHIVRFMDAAGDIPPTHFIAIEQELVLECRSSLYDACHPVRVYGISS